MQEVDRLEEEIQSWKEVDHPFELEENLSDPFELGNYSEMWAETGNHPTAMQVVAPVDEQGTPSGMQADWIEMENWSVTVQKVEEYQLKCQFLDSYLTAPGANIADLEQVEYWLMCCKVHWKMHPQTQSYYSSPSSGFVQNSDLH